MPDSSIMLDLCKELKISVNELLNGEMINMNEYGKKTEELLVELAKIDELKNKKLLVSMWTILISSTIFYIGIMLLAVWLLEEGTMLGIIITLATLIYIVVCFVGLKFELEAGYYECKECKNKFVPTYKEIMFSLHIGTTRYLKCPKCNKRTWAKKVMKK